MAGYSNALAVVIAFVVFPSSMVLAQTTYHVGRAADWNDPLFDYQGWAFGIYAHPGDSLEFVYHANQHSIVVAANRELFDACSSTPNLGVYQSGYEVLVLPDAGTYYFFCPNQCQQGMKFFLQDTYSNALVVLIAFVVFPSMVLAFQITYHVGRSADWNEPLFDYQGWANSINAHPGDSLDFTYDANLHSVVVAANRELFDACSSTPNLGVYQSGYEILVLPDAGTYCFFCPNQCNQGMKFFLEVS